MGVEIPALRRSARDQVCTFMLPGICNGDRSTVVLCHCRIGHAGMGTKPPDHFAAFGCFSCHAAIDGHMLPPLDEARAWLRAILRTHMVWYEEGLMTFPETPRRPARVSSKIIPHDGRMRR